MRWENFKSSLGKKKWYVLIKQLKRIVPNQDFMKRMKVFRDYIECSEAKKMVKEFNLIKKAERIEEETGEWILTEEEMEKMEEEDLGCYCEDCKRTGSNIELFWLYYPNIKRFDIVDKNYEE